MNKLVPVSVGAAVVIVAIVAGARLLTPPEQGGVGAQSPQAPSPATPRSSSVTPSLAPTEAPTSTPATFEVRQADSTGPGITVTVPAPGWSFDPEFDAFTKGAEIANLPEAMLLIWTFAPGTDFYVYGDPCRWESTTPDNAATTPYELVAALAAQANREASEPVDVTIGGYAGKSVTLHVPDDAIFDDCDGGMFATYGVDGDLGARSQQGPGQIDELWVVDVGGARVVLDAMYRPDTRPEVLEEMRSLAESATFVAPTGTGQAHVLAESTEEAVGITVTTHAGWSGEPDAWFMERGPAGADPPNGAGIIVFVVDEEFYVYGDPCKWMSTRPETPATTVDQLAAALGSQTSRSPTPAEDIILDGYRGKRLTVHVPNDVDFSECDDGKFASFGVAGEDPARWHQGPGQIDEMWIVDVDGRIALLDGAYFAETPQDAIDELHAILRSATFD